MSVSRSELDMIRRGLGPTCSGCLEKIDRVKDYKITAFLPDGMECEAHKACSSHICTSLTEILESAGYIERGSLREINEYTGKIVAGVRDDLIAQNTTMKQVSRKDLKKLLEKKVEATPFSPAARAPLSD